ncbi:MAG TPA: vWA domain-containing protein, partial [Polyangiaceae bacterium]|nr:vWA domain-containing protein [Polyangiaceae bacterium]
MSAAGAAAVANGGKGGREAAGTGGVSGMSLGGAAGGGTAGRGTTAGGASGAAGTGNEQAGSDDGGTGSPGGGSSGASGMAGRAGSASGGSGGSCAGPSTLLFLVDTSQSMAEEVAGLTKMELTADALRNAFANLPSDAAVGLMFFPLMELGSMPCFDASLTVPLDALDEDQRAALDAAVASVQPSGATPTHDAYRFALENLKSSALAGPKYIVLITDGAPTYSLGCVGNGTTGEPVDPQPLVDEAAGANANG